MKLTELQIAEQIARAAHTGQKREGGGAYIVHPACVAEMMDTKDRKVVAWLHDVLEDTPISAAYLRVSGISPRNVELVQTLSHKPNELYYDYIMRISKDADAIIIKLADLTHNLMDQKDGHRKQKYLLARQVLKDRLNYFYDEQ